MRQQCTLSSYAIRAIQREYSSFVPVGEVADMEGRLGNTCRLDTTPQDIRVVWQVSVFINPIYRIEEAMSNKTAKRRKGEKKYF